MDLSGVMKLKICEVTDLEKLKELLTVPNPAYENFKKYSRFGTSPEENLYFYSEDSDSIYVPRNIPKEFYDTHEGYIHDNRSRGDCINAEFTGKLRPYQESFYCNFSEISPNDAIWEIQCGGGKTVLALYHICKLKKKTVVFVPTLFLAKQWFNAVSEFTEGAECRIFEGKNNKDAFRSCDILIINLDRFETVKFPQEFLDSFGLVIYDECHRTAAHSYYPIIEKFSAFWRLGLSATFRRRDGLHRILGYQFGELFSMEPVSLPAIIQPLYTEITIDSEKFEKKTDFKRVTTKEQLSSFIRAGIHNYSVKNLEKKIRKEILIYESKGVFYEGSIHPKNVFDLYEYDTCTGYKLEADFVNLDTFVSMMGYRNKMIISAIGKLAKSGRVLLVLGKRKDQLEFLNSQFIARGFKTSLIVGSKKVSKEESKFIEITGASDFEDYTKNHAQIIFGIDKLANEGLDVPRCDTLFILNYLRDIQQPKGRIERIYEGKKTPVMFYPIDEIPVSMGMFNASKKFSGKSEIRPPINFSKFLGMEF